MGDWGVVFFEGDLPVTLNPQDQDTGKKKLDVVSLGIYKNCLSRTADKPSLSKLFISFKAPKALKARDRWPQKEASKNAPQTPNPKPSFCCGVLWGVQGLAG